MKTIYVKDVVRRIARPGKWDWQKAIPTFIFLCAMFFLGRAAAEVIGEMRLTSAPVMTESENWGRGGTVPARQLILEFRQGNSRGNLTYTL